MTRDHVSDSTADRGLLAIERDACAVLTYVTPNSSATVNDDKRAEYEPTNHIIDQRSTCKLTRMSTEVQHDTIATRAI